MTTRPAIAALFAWMAAASLGCGAGEPVRWSLELSETRATAEWVVIEVHRGGCRQPASTRVVRRGELASEDVALRPGVHGFGGQVIDASCRVIGRVCEDVMIAPGAESFVVTVRPVTPPERCELVGCPVAECTAATDAGAVVEDARAECTTSAECPAMMECCAFLCRSTC